MKDLTLIEKSFFLKKVEIFNDLDLDLLLAIADKLSQDLYDKGEKVFALSQVANRIYFIAKGKVKIADEMHNLITTLSIGDYFGDEGLFNYSPRAYEAECLQDSLILTLSRTHLLTIISESPSVAINLLHSYAKSLPCRLKK